MTGTTMDNDRPWLLWRRTPNFVVTCVAIGVICGRDSERRLRVVAGDTDGVVHVLDVETGSEVAEDRLEIRRGSITALLLTPEHIIVGDAAHNVVVYTACQMVYKLDMESPVTSLAIVVDQMSNKTFVAGDSGGSITGFRGHDIHWRMSLRDFTHDGVEEAACSVRATATDVEYSETKGSLKLVVADTRGLVHIFVGEHLQCSILSPCIINTICRLPERERHCGRNKTRVAPNATCDADDAFLIAGEDGVIYRLDGTEIVHTGSLGYAVTQARAIDTGTGAAMLYAGDFDGFRFIQDGKIHDIRLGDWVHNFHTRAEHIVASTMDNNLWLMKSQALCDSMMKQ